MPPVSDDWNQVSARAATQRGTESCTPTLSKAIISMFAAPATVTPP
jgi:hypothetical protein